MIAVAEPHGNVVLYKHDAVEDAAAHITRALEGVEAASYDGNGVLTLLQPAPQICILGWTEQCLADCGNRNQRGLHVDEGGLRRFGDGTIARAFVGMFGKGCVDLSDIER